MKEKHDFQVEQFNWSSHLNLRSIKHNIGRKIESNEIISAKSVNISIEMSGGK